MLDYIVCIIVSPIYAFFIGYNIFHINNRNVNYYRKKYNFIMNDQLDKTAIKKAYLINSVQT